MILVWANSHPTYLMAFGLYGAFFADALVRAAWRKEFQWARLRTWIIPPLVTGVAGLVLCGLNPHGYGWLLSPLHMISRGAGGNTNNILMSISELTPVKGTGFYVYYKAAVVFAAVSLCLGLAGRRVYLLDLFLFAIAFKGAWDSARAVSMMGLFLSPGASLHLTGFLSEAAGWFSTKVTRKPEAQEEKRRQKGKKGPQPAAVSDRRDPSPGFTAGHAAIVGVVVLALVAFGGTTLAFSFSQLEYGVGITEHKFSFKAAEFLRKNPVPGKDVQLLRHRRVPRLAAIPRRSNLPRRQDLQPAGVHGAPVGHGGDARVGAGHRQIRDHVHRPEDDGLLGDDPSHRADPRQQPELVAGLLRRPVRHLRPQHSGTAGIHQGP